MKDDHVGFLLEDIQDKLQGIAESVSDVHTDIRDLKDTTAVLPRINTNVETIKTVVSEHSQELKAHEARITTLERVGQ